MPLLVVLWEDREHASDDDGMAVVSGKWAQEARWEDKAPFRSS
jgi:hypothetical protein